MTNLELLLYTLQADHTTHAYLFEGTSNSDMKMASAAFAQAVLCQHSNACGTCPGCLLFQAGTHPDYHVLSVEGDTIKIREHMEPFFQDLRLSSPYSKRKIYIIEDAHKMNSASQNSILKTLEEPASGVIILLMTDNSNLLLPTILSRVVRYHFRESSETETYSKEFLDIFAQIMRQIESKRAADRIAAAAELTNRRNEFKELSDLMQVYYRNSLVAKYTNNPVLINTPKTDKISADGIFAAIKIIEETRFALKSNANTQLTMDLLVTKLHDLYHV